jgi:hypothetical protein
MPGFEFASAAEAWIFTVMSLVGAALGPWAAVRLWTDRIPRFRDPEPPAFWAFPASMWRAFLRTGTWNSAGFGVIFALGAILVLFVSPGLLGSVPEPAGAAVLVLLLMVFVVVVAVDVAIVLWARPRRLVPPHLRRLPGWVAERGDRSPAS